jgi:hypothetical protein
MNAAIKIAKWLITVVTVLLLTVYFVRAFDSRRMPQLGPEHRIEFDSEFEASREDETDWAAYLAIEEALAAELKDKIDSDARPESLADRYSDVGTLAARRGRIAARPDRLALFDALNGANAGWRRLQRCGPAHAGTRIRGRRADTGTLGRLDRGGSYRSPAGNDPCRQ